jgi:hypothetical protein
MLVRALVVTLAFPAVCFAQDPTAIDRLHQLDQGHRVHYVNGALVGDGVIDERHPEALIYEPVNGRLQLVAAEFIVLAAQWDASHSDGAPPTLMGQVFHYNGSPNRYRLPPFYELHVWADKQNPSGAFADWNPHVSCDTYAANP